MRCQGSLLKPLLLSTLVLSVGGCGLRISHSAGSFTIGETRGEICALNNNLALVVWTDDPGGGASGGTGGDPVFHGEFRLKDARRIPWSCSTRDGKTGRVTIAGDSYDLANGGMFLVRTKGGGMKVEQLPLSILGVSESTRAFESARAKLQELASTDPKIAAFVKGALDAK
jgi:hypothetical protein